MGTADVFLHTLVHYNKENIHQEIVKAVQPYIKDPEFTPETVITKSSAAAGMDKCYNYYIISIYFTIIQ